MKLVFLPSADEDLRWFRLYYDSLYLDGGRRSWRQFAKAAKRLAVFPQLGHPTDRPGVREFAIAGIPFSLIYRVAEDRIEILRLWDQRAERPDDWIDR